MKKKMMSACLLSVALMLTACTNEKAESSVAPAEAKQTQTTMQESTNPVYSFAVENEFYEQEEEGSCKENRYELTLTDDKRAVLEQIFSYPNDGMFETVQKSVGNYEKKENQIDFRVDNTREVYVFTLNGDTVEKVDYHYIPDIEEDMTGTYTCSSEEFGDMTLNISPYYEVELSTATQRTFKGTLTKYNDRLEMMITEDNSEQTFYDWYVYFDGNTFTYEDYYYAFNEKYEGEYNIWGQLGDLTVVIDEKGKATCDVPVDGVIKNMSGNANFNEDTGILESVYLYDEQQNSIDLYINQMGDILNYSGTITTSLSAG